MTPPALVQIMSQKGETMVHAKEWQITYLYWNNLNIEGEGSAGVTSLGVNQKYTHHAPQVPTLSFHFIGFPQLRRSNFQMCCYHMPLTS